jgi:hypothetical protein
MSQLSSIIKPDVCREMSKNEMHWVRQTEFGWGVGYTQLFCIKISGVYEKPLEFFTPGPQLACSPGT